MYETGSVVAGRYRVDHVLGRGGMGVVVAATHVELGTRAALKFLTAGARAGAELIERFLREARTAGRLRSEHVCRVRGVGRLDDGAPFLVMELLEGHDLARVLADHGALSVAIAAEYIVQACDAIAEAHAADIVHRDLKPANLFLARRPAGGALIKVLDFGVARDVARHAPSITQVDAVIGSPAYTAPEQARSAHRADARSDVWSLGAILYELVAGQPPFAGESAAALALRIADEPAPRLAGVPDGFAAVVARCLERDPQRRFPRVADLVAALRPFAPHADLMHRLRTMDAFPELPTLRLERPATARIARMATTFSPPRPIARGSTPPGAPAWCGPAAPVPSPPPLAAPIRAPAPPPDRGRHADAGWAPRQIAPWAIVAIVVGLLAGRCAGQAAARSGSRAIPHSARLPV